MANIGRWKSNTFMIPKGVALEIAYADVQMFA